jgi:hypothetical protein
MSEKKNCKCLLIKTKDNREFFTHEKNFLQLIEFSKTFGAEVSVVKVNKAEVLDLEELAPAICNDGYNPNGQYEVLEVKIPNSKKVAKSLNKRQKILQTATIIKAHILTEFLSGKEVTLHGVRKKFKKYDLSLSAVCNHISRVRQELESEGYKIEKAGAGRYRLA